VYLYSHFTGFIAMSRNNGIWEGYRLVVEARLELPDGQVLKASEKHEAIEWIDSSQPKVDPPGRIAHSPDFASVRWVDGKLYTFTPNQRSIISILWQAALDGTPDVSQGYLLAEIDAEQSKMSLVFRDHPAMGVVIRRSSECGGPAGCYRVDLANSA
jgi:hypothetical protein